MRFGNISVTYRYGAFRIYSMHRGIPVHGTSVYPSDLFRDRKNFHRQLRAAFRIWEDSRKAF